MPDNSLPCLDLLAATPGILRDLMCEMTPEDALWKPAPDRFSVGEVLAHLSHAEGHSFRLRVDLILDEERPAVEDYDASNHLDLYRDADPEDAFDHFEEQRESNVEFLASVEAGAAARTAVHPEAGEFTLAQLLHAWALHDLGHIRQIAELIRARKYLAGAGALGRFHTVKP